MCPVRRKMTDALRAQVKFALTRQPTEETAALTGDAYGIMPIAFFVNKVPLAWLDGILQADLYHEHARKDGDPVTGVNMLDFHEHVARLVAEVDPDFESGAHHQSRSLNARAIHAALIAWVAEEKKEEKEEEEDTVIDINI